MSEQPQEGWLVYPESVLLESRSARTAMNHRVEVLDRVGALALSPDGVRASTRDVAAYFEVGVKAVEKLVERHRKELQESGMEVVTGPDLQKYQTDKMSVCSEGNPGYPQGSYPQRRKSLLVFSRRAVLNIAMLLRDSEVARRVRGYLLDAEAVARTGATADGDERWREVTARLTRVEASVAEVGTVLRELGPVLARMSKRLHRIEHRLDGVEHRLDRVEERLDGVEYRLDRVEERLDAVEHRLDGVERRLGRVERRSGRVEFRLGRVAHRVGGVEMRTVHTERLLCGLSRRFADGV